MSFKSALWILAAFLVLPLAGFLYTVFSQPKHERRHAKAERAAARAEKPKAEKALPKPDRDAPDEPVRLGRAPSHFVTIKGDIAESALGLKGHLIWRDDGKGSKITNPCGSSTCLSDSGAKLCAKGVAGRLKGERWGAGVTWNLKEGPEGPVPIGKTKLKGLSFVFESNLKGEATGDAGQGDSAKAANSSNYDLASSTPPGSAKARKNDKRGAKDDKPASPEAPPYYFSVRVGQTDYCTPIQPGQNRVLFKRLRKDCQESKGPKLPEGVIPEAKWAQWWVASRKGENRRFDFCLSELKTIE